MSELKPCQFCESNDIDILTYEEEYHTRKVAECMDCGARGSVCDSKEEAIEAWNTRPAEDALKAEIERLKAALNEIRTIGDCTAMIEDVVARGMMRKIAFDTLYGNKSLGQDTDVPANATDTNVGRMEEK